MWESIKQISPSNGVNDVVSTPEYISRIEKYKSFKLE